MAGRWSKTGLVIEVLDHETYLLRVDGSSRQTKRNRRFLRKITPFPSLIQGTPSVPQPPPFVPPKPPITVTPVPVPASQPQQPASSQPVEPVQLPDHHIPEVQQQPDHVPPPAHQINKLKRHVPPHLREKWIVNPKFLKSDTIGAMQRDLSCYSSAFNHNNGSWGEGGIYRTS